MAVATPEAQQQRSEDLESDWIPRRRASADARRDGVAEHQWQQPSSRTDRRIEKQTYACLMRIITRNELFLIIIGESAECLGPA